MIQTIIDYLDSLFEKETIFYNLTSKGKEATNISKFLKEQIESELLDPIIIQEGWYKITDSDRLIYLITKWVHNNITYISDTANYKQTEYWATVKQILTTRKDDCEGGACLIVALGRKCGIPKERLKLWCGDVTNPNKNSINKTVGHATVIYKSTNYTWGWFIMDWCYYYINKLPSTNIDFYQIDKDLNMTPNNKYIKAWFIVDEEKGTKRFK